jgi:protein TonB
MSAVLLPQGGVLDIPHRPLPALPLQRPVDPLSGQKAGNRGAGLAVVVALHVLIGWALASGLARQAIEIVKKPITMSIIPEVVPPPPPPAPPKVEKIKETPKVQAPPPPAYVPPPEVQVAAPPPPIVAVQAEPPKEPVVIEPPAPPAPPAPKPVAKQEVSVACPGYQAVIEQMLGDAFERVGIAGTVRSRLTIRGNQVVDVAQLSGPKEYTKYIQPAIKRLKCSSGGTDDVQVNLDVQFKP